MWTRVEKPVEKVEKLIRRSRHSLHPARLALAVLLALWGSAASAQQGPPAADAAPAAIALAQAAQKEALPGVDNFGRVTLQLYRGAQPKAAGFDELQKLSVEIIVDFRDEEGEIERERSAVEARRWLFVSIPWNAHHDPSPGQVKQFFDVLRAHPDKKIFVHCHYGADRTGTMVALYRIAAQGWTVDDAVREMKAYHFHGFWFPHLARYVRKFPQQIESDPALWSGSLPAPQPATP